MMSIIKKFIKITDNIEEYILKSTTKISEDNFIGDNKRNIRKRFIYYYNKKNFKQLENLIEETDIIYNLEQSSNELKQRLIFLAAKENKTLASQYITKYKPQFTTETLVGLMNDDNIAALELYMINASVKFEHSYERLLNPIHISQWACIKQKIKFLEFASSFPNLEKSFYEEVLQYNVENNWHEGIKFIVDNYKEKISQEVFDEVTKLATKSNKLEVAEYIKENSTNNVSLTNSPLDQKIKQLRTEHFGKSNTNNVLKN